MDFKEVIDGLKEGRMYRRGIWEPGEVVFLDKHCARRGRLGCRDSWMYVLALDDIRADDWEEAE